MPLIKPLSKGKIKKFSLPLSRVILKGDDSNLTQTSNDYIKNYFSTFRESRPFYITNGVTHDGFGSRIQRCICVMAYVYYLQELGFPVEYLHTPFSYIGFNEDYKQGEEDRMKNGNDYPYNDNGYEGYMSRAKEWDDYLGFRGKTVDDVKISKLNIVNDKDPMFGYYRLAEDVLNNQTDGKLYVIKMLHYEYDNHIINISNVKRFRSKIIQKFSLNIPSYNNKNIAIHIRRKDAIDYSNRYVSDEHYLEILDAIKKYKSDYKVSIFTQRVGFDETKYDGYEIFYDDTENDYETFVKLMSSKHLIAGKSSFSYAAALLNPNLIVYHFDGHTGLKEWIDKEKYIKKIKKIK